MSESLFSPSWFRVSELRPRLRSHVTLHRMTARGRTSFVLQDHATGQFHRFSPAAHALIGLMDGRHTVAEIWRSAGEALGDDLPTQDETIRLLRHLHGADALATDAPVNVEELQHRADLRLHRRRLQRIRSPLAIRLPLVDPDRFLSATLPLVRPFLSPFGAALWLVVVASAGVLAAEQWAPLTENLADRVLGTTNLLLLWAVFPLLKLCHELGHGYAVKASGGEVHEMGVMLLVFIPVPYVDASAATAFPEPWRRALVGAAGLLVELFLAALAMFLWTAVEPGLVRAVCFNMMAIAAVSSLLFNGNPFLRFDAYYVLSDLLRIPNLGTRANRWWGYVVRRFAFGQESAENPSDAPGEAGWFAFYGVASYLNRFVVMAGIALLVASRLFVIGALLALLTAGQFLVWPIVCHARTLLTDAALGPHRVRALAVTGGTLAALALLVALVPFPRWTLTEGVVRVPESAHLRSEAEGWVVELLGRSGEQVKAGDLILRIEDPELPREHDAARARVAASRTRYSALRTRDPVEADIARQEVRHREAELARVEERLAAQGVMAPSAGRLLLADETHLIGRFIRRGQTLGFVVDDENVQVRAVVGADDVDAVRGATQAVAVRFAERFDEVLPARLASEVPAATAELPSLALADIGGGPIPLDPIARGDERAFEQHFLFDLAIVGEARLERLGGRVHVRFEHPAEPLIARLWRALRRLFLGRLGV